MATVVDTPLTLHLRPALEMTDDQFFQFCQVNEPWQMERTAHGDILIMAPAGVDGSSRNSSLSRQLDEWAERDGSGVAFESSAGFTLPNGAVRSPDASWVRKTRLRKLPVRHRHKFAPMCPDFVAELRSPSDHLATLKAKMQEYIENGAQLGWLLDPKRRQVYVYRPHAQVQRLDDPKSLSGAPVLPGFVLDLRRIWDPGF